MQHTADVVWNCTPETHVVLVTNVTRIHSTEKKKERAPRVLAHLWGQQRFDSNHLHRKKFRLGNGLLSFSEEGAEK